MCRMQESALAFDLYDLQEESSGRLRVLSRRPEERKVEGGRPKIRTSRPLEPSQGPKPRHRHGHRGEYNPQEGVQLRSMHLGISNAQSQRRADDPKDCPRRPNPQRHLRLDRSHGVGGRAIFYSVHRRRNGDDFFRPYENQNGNGSPPMLPRISEHLRTRRTPSSRFERTAEANTENRWGNYAKKPESTTK